MTAKNLLLAGQSIDHWGLRNARFEGELPEGYETAETDDLRSFYFKPDGTKLYLVGRSEDSIFQYSLSTAWDIRTATYDSKSYAVTTEEDIPHSLWLKNDGTKMYVSGTDSDTVYQYTLATAWDVSSATYDTVFLSVNSQDGRPIGIVFKPDGTSFYIVGDNNKTVFQYDLTSAWDLSTASYASKSKDISTEITDNFHGLTFSSDGTKMYAGSNTPQIIYQYSLSTAWDVSTASYDSKKFTSQAVDGFGLFMRDTDEQIIAGNTGTFLISFNLSTAQDITTCTASVKNAFFYPRFENPRPLDGKISSNGEHFYLAYGGDDIPVQLDLTEPFVIGTAVDNNKTLDTSGTGASNNGMDVSKDGTKFYFPDSPNRIIYQYTTSTPFEMPDATYDSKSLDTTTNITSGNITATRISSDGENYYIGINNNGLIYQYSLSTPFDISTASYVDSFDFTAYHNGIFGFDISPDGQKIIIGSSETKKHTEWKLTTSWDITTATFVNEFDVSSFDVDIAAYLASQALSLSPKGDKLYFIRIGYIPFIYQLSL